MIDSDNDNVNTPAATSQERLEVTVFHLTQLYQRLSHDRDHWTRTGRQLAGATDTFNQQLQQWAQLDKAVQQQLTATIDEGSHQITSALTTTFKEATHAVLTERLKDIEGNLRTILQETRGVLRDYQDNMARAKQWWVVIAFLNAVLGSMMGGGMLYYLCF